MQLYKLYLHSHYNSGRINYVHPGWCSTFKLACSLPIHFCIPLTVDGLWWPVEVICMALATAVRNMVPKGKFGSAQLHHSIIRRGDKGIGQETTRNETSSLQKREIACDIWCIFFFLTMYTYIYTYIREGSVTQWYHNFSTIMSLYSAMPSRMFVRNILMHLNFSNLQ